MVKKIFWVGMDFVGSVRLQEMKVVVLFGGLRYDIHCITT